MKANFFVTAATGHIGLPAIQKLLKLGFEVGPLVKNSKGVTHWN